MTTIKSALQEFKRKQLEDALIATRGAYDAAERLGISPKTLYNWLAKFGLIEDDGKVRVRKLRVRLRLQRSTGNEL